MRRSKLTIILLAFVLMFSLIISVGCGGGNEADVSKNGGASSDVKSEEDKVYVMKFSHATSTEGARHATVVSFKEKIEAATDGRIKVEIYPNSQLGNNVSVMQGLQVGTIEAQIAPTAYMSGFEELVTVIDLPFLWPDMDTALDILNFGDFGADLMKSGEEKGIITAAFWGIGDKNMITTFPMEKAEDLKGHKIRIMDDPLLIEQFKSWGATGVPIAYDELYNSLQQGIVEGYENTLDAWYEMKFFEVAKHFAFTEHGQMIDGVFISKPWFDSLPQDLQEAVLSVAKECVEDRKQQVKAATEKAIEQIAIEAPDCVYYETSDEVRSELADKVQGVHDIFAGRSAAHEKCLEDLKAIIAAY